MKNPTGETDLAVLIANLEPVLNTGDYVFTSVRDTDSVPGGIAVCEIKEQEGTTLVLHRTDADTLGLPYDYIASWITLNVHSSLEAVGLTAAFARALGDNGISCNVLAGYYHDHLFVDKKDAEKALQVLKGMSSNGAALSYVDATAEAGRDFYLRYRDQGEIVMLNLLKFREVADYTAFPELDAGVALSGAEAYRKYLRHTAPFLTAAGGEVLYAGTGGRFLIGPEAEGWDMVLLVRHRSADAFIAFARNEEYLQGIGHRTAALADSRLLPLEAAGGLVKPIPG